MSTAMSFHELIGLVRGGGAAAPTALVRQYVPAIRRSLRLRLNLRWRRTADSMDICQAVLCSFFVPAASGQYESETPEQLLTLLVTRARHNLSKARREELRERLDAWGVEVGSADEPELMASGSSFSQQVATRELLVEVHRRLSAEERQLIDLRNQGHHWSAIGAAPGAGPEALRKNLARAALRFNQNPGVEAGHE